MIAVRSFVLAAVVGLVLLATPRLSSAQMVPDFPTGGTRAQRSPEPTTPQTQAPIGGLRYFVMGFPAGVVLFDWLAPSIGHRFSTRPKIVALRTRFGR